MSDHNINEGHIPDPNPGPNANQIGLVAQLVVEMSAVLTAIHAEAARIAAAVRDNAATQLTVPDGYETDDTDNSYSLGVPKTNSSGSVSTTHTSNNDNRSQQARQQQRTTSSGIVA